MPRHALATTALTLLLMSFMTLPAPVAAAEEQVGETVRPPRHFDVFLDDRTLGTHRFSFAIEDDALRVRSRAEFAVKMLFVTVFSYDHESDELWRNGCLVEVSSETGDNGALWQVEGSALDDGFLVDNGRETLRIDDACPWTFAYWDQGIVERTRLLNAQTGRERAISVSGPFEGYAPGLNAWRLEGEDLDTTLHYDAAGRWLGLDSRTDGDQVVRYRPARDDVWADAAAASGSRP